MVDWWAVGVIIFEMLEGSGPFGDEASFESFDQVVQGKLQIPDHFEPLAKDIVAKLLTVEESKRLGKNGAEEIKNHPWFGGINWNQATNTAKGPLYNTSNFTKDRNPSPVLGLEVS